MKYKVKSENKLFLVDASSEVEAVKKLKDAKERKKLNDGYYWNDIRQLCIKNNYYTYGTNAQYDNLFEMARTGKWNAEQIATDIDRHSDEHADYNTILSQIKKLNPKAVSDSSIKDYSYAEAVAGALKRKLGNVVKANTYTGYGSIGNNVYAYVALSKSEVESKAGDVLKRYKAKAIPDGNETKIVPINDAAIKDTHAEWICAHWPTDSADRRQLDNKLRYFALWKELRGNDAIIKGNVENVKKFMTWLGVYSNRFNEIQMVDSAIKDASYPSRLDPKHAAEYGWTIPDFGKTIIEIFWAAVEVNAKKFTDLNQFAKAVATTGKEMYDDFSKQVIAEFNKLIAEGRNKINTFEESAKKNIGNVLKDSAIKDSGYVESPRGTLKLVEQPEDVLKADGYGYWFSFDYNGKKYKAMSNMETSAAVAIEDK